MTSRRRRVAPEIAEQVLIRDGGCLGPRIGMPGECYGRIELDHIRASGGLGMKSPSTPENLASLCSLHHRVKTEHGREWRPPLIAEVWRRTHKGME